jgi:hypothetical protein
MSNKFDPKARIIEPLNTSPASDVLLARGKRDTKGNNILNGKLIHAVGFNIGATKAEIF